MRYEVIDGKGIIPDGATEIEYYAFGGCTSLQSIVISGSITKIGREAFKGCTSLQSIVIPDSVTEIEYSAFSGCTGLQSIELPDSVSEISGSVFIGCNNLTSIIVSRNNSEYKSINNCILTKDGKELVLCRNHNIPDSVTIIGYFSFSGCTSLQSIVIPDSVTKIGNHAFQYCIYNHRTTKTNQKYPSVNL
uniref:leucine-rich repeat domain-containing protein n=1 Tax=Candidatus Cryptobacteroides bacterium TaxID=3085639 RepID=UPI00402A4B13